VLTASIIRAMMVALMMEAVSTSETSVIFYQTSRHNIPKDSNLHTRRLQNLKSPLEIKIFFTNFKTTPASAKSNFIGIHRVVSKMKNSDRYELPYLLLRHILCLKNTKYPSHVLYRTRTKDRSVDCYARIGVKITVVQILNNIWQTERECPFLFVAMGFQSLH
jgi:hypothetical protein